MSRRFAAVVYVYDRHEGAWCPRVLGQYRRAEGARRRVRRWLDARPCYETREARDTRAPWGEVWRDDATITTEPAAVCLVPSVGEVGYW